MLVLRHPGAPATLDSLHRAGLGAQEPVQAHHIGRGLEARIRTPGAPSSCGNNFNLALFTFNVDYEKIVPFIPNLRRYARALVGDRDGADDLVQDTLERAVRKFHLWRPGDLRAWLFSIMHNVFINQLKARKITSDVEIDDTFAAPVPSATRADVLDLQRALGTLAPEQREVVLLIALEDMSYSDVSRALGIPMGTVMSRLSRGRERLRKVMNGEAERSGLRVVQ
jgi:RNA polymerase sigma-70 factor, ECF subfamily